MLRADKWMYGGAKGRRVSSVRLVWEDVPKSRWRETLFGGPVSGCALDLI